MPFFPGREASITIGGTAKPLDEMEFKINGEVIDTTNFTSLGWQESYLGIKGVEITAGGPYNGIASGAAAADSIVDAAVTVVFDIGGAGPTWTVTARLQDVNIKTAVRDVGRISYTMISTGPPTLVY